MKKHEGNIVLIGFMGTGKSTVGRELKRLLSAELIDMDQEIEKRDGRKIREIFAQDGESFFRQKETELLEYFLTQSYQNTIISTGGGVIISEKNRSLLKQIGFVAWLRADAETIHQRTKTAKTRPILHTENPLQVIQELLEIRTPLYESAADLTIDVNGLDKNEIAVGIMESMRYQQSREDEKV